MKKLIFTPLAFIAGILFAFCQELPDCSELFISEYVEGTGKNRVIEIYNPSNITADLSQYSVKTFASGPNNPSVLQLSGTLPVKGRTSCGHEQANPNILVLCDFISSELKFDGDDAVGLYKNDVLIDMIGEIGVNPGNSGWQVGAGFTKDNTLRRGYDVRGPTAYWTQSVFEWDILPTDDVSGLGDHDGVCADATVKFAGTSSSFGEGAGNVKLKFTYNNPLDFDLTGRIAHNPNTANCIDPVLATRNDDYETTNPWAQVITFVLFAETAESVYATIYIIDDQVYEEKDEAICFKLLSSDYLTAVYPSEHTMMIIDNDDPAGIDDLNEDNIKIYPSVADENLFIEGVPDGTGVRVSIYNIFGQQVISKDGDTQQGKIRVGIRTLVPGMYVLSLEGLKGTVTKKFIKN